MKKLISLICILAGISGAFAQTNSEDIYKLTANDVTHFIKHYPDLEVDLNKLGVKYDHDDGDFTLPEGIEALADFNNVLQKHGYKDYQEFIVKAGAIVLAYASLKSDDGMADAQAEIKASLKEIDENPALSAEQKQMMKQQIEAGMAMMQMYSTNLSTSANIKVVEQYIDELDKMLQEKE